MASITAGQQNLLFPLQVKQFHEASVMIIFLMINDLSIGITI